MPVGSRFGQSTTNLDFFRELESRARASAANGAGAEFRLDKFQITAGDSASWINGGQRDSRWA